MADANAYPEPHYQPTLSISYVPLDDSAKYSKSDPDVARLLSRRERYEEDCAWWALLRQSYIGGREWMTARNLPPHLLEMNVLTRRRGNVLKDSLVPVTDGAPRSAGAPEYETRNEYDLRVAQGFRLNLTREIVEPLSGMLRQNPPEENLPTGPDGLKTFNEEADLARSKSLDDIVNMAVEWAMVLGVYYVAVDSTMSPARLKELLSAAGKKIGAPIKPDALGRYPASIVPPAESKPHAWLIDPTCVLDGTVDEETGEFSEVLMAERRHNGKAIGSGGCIETFFRYWTREKWEQWQLVKDGKAGKGKLKAVRTASGPNAIGRIPIMRVIPWDMLGSPWRGRSIVEDAVLVDRALAGLASSLFFSLENDADSQIIASANLSAFESQDDPNLIAFMAQVRETLRSRIGAIHSGVDVKVLNKDSGQKELMLSTYTEMLRLQMRLMGLSDKVDEPGAESGIARLRRQHILGAILANLAMAKARAQRDALYFAVLFLGGDGETVTRDTIRPPLKFDVRSISDMLLLHRELSGKIPPEWEKLLLFDLWKLYFGDRPPDWLSARKAELDAWTPPADTTQQPAVDIASLGQEF